MIKTGKIRLLSLLIVGLIVLAAPLLFFNSLLATALQRTEDSAMGLLREKLLQETERVKELMTPAAYIKATIKKIHTEILPEVTQDLIKLFPDKDFGEDIFDNKLPEQMLKALRAHHLEPLFITVTSPEFVNIHYWFARELRNQCPEPDNLAAVIGYELLAVSCALYQQYYQNNWLLKHSNANAGRLSEFGFFNATILNFTYLNRFHEFILPHDTVKEIFTDYFGKQSLYHYAYNCLSRENIHGSYMIGVLQAAIKPSEILNLAIKQSSDQVEVSLIELSEQKSGFVQTREALEYFDHPPTEFWNHFFFRQRWFKRRFAAETRGYHIRLRAAQPDEVRNLRNNQQVFRIAANCLLLLYLMTAVYYWLFGFRMRLTIRRKLVMLLAVIILIPVTGTGLFAIVSLKGSDRLIENHVLEKTHEMVRDFNQYDDENDLRQQLVMFEIKRRLEEYEGKTIDLKAMLTRRGENFDWFKLLTSRHTFITGDGTMLHFASTLTSSERDSHKLLDVIMPKYFTSLGLLRKKGNMLANTLALGIFEDYVTPEREEASLPHESTIQHDISHTLDTSRATTILAKMKNNEFVFAYSRPVDASVSVYAYLGEFAKAGQKWFARSDPYCDIELGARLRRHYELQLYAWPTNTLLNDEILESFRRAMELKDSGRRIIHTDSGIKARVWSHRPSRATLFAAIGQSRGKGIGHLTVSMLFPLLTGYAILLIMVLSLLFAEFIIKPVNIFSEAIERLSNEEYGVFIEKFSGDEFSQMTTAFNKMSAALKQREMIKRLVSQKLIEKVENTDNSAISRTEKVRISVVASDIRGFTTISEKHSPSEVVELLNTYFTAMEEAISQNAGVIDKYIGDAIQAVFYEKAGLKSSAHRACQAASAMRLKLEELNRHRVRDGLYTLENGIGIATGLAISGSIGSETGRKDFTIIGKITEQAAQLETLTPDTKSKILVCNTTQSAATDDFRFARHNDNSWELIDAS